MERNKIADFAVKIIDEYAKENGINARDTTDLSPLEQWLILRLYNVVEKSEQLVCDKPKIKWKTTLPCYKCDGKGCYKCK